MKTKDDHRPIEIINQKILSEEEEKQILALAKESDLLLKELHKNLDIIINKYRDIIGYKNLHCTWKTHWKNNQIEWWHDKNWISDAKRTRLQWFMSDIKLDEKYLYDVFYKLKKKNTKES